MLGFKTGVIRKKGEGKESLVRSRAYGFADSNGIKNPIWPAAAKPIPAKGTWYDIIYSRMR